MSRRPFRSTSDGRRRAFSLLAAAALLTGALLAVAIPALAHTGHPGRAIAAASAPRVASATTTTTTTAATRTSSAPTQTSGSSHAAPQQLPKSWVGAWSKPFAVMGPVDADLIAPVVGVSAADTVAVGGGTTNEDAPQDARANVITGTARNAFRKLALSGTQQTLAVGYLANRLVLLTGTSPAADSCCSTTSARVATSSTSFSAGDPVADNLEGTTDGALVNVKGGMLAAVDNQAGITVSRSDSRGDFNQSAQLVPSDPTPALMAVSPLADGGAVVAWSAPETSAQTVTGTSTTPGSSTTASGYDQPVNQLIYFATAAPTGLPGKATLAVRVPSGREIDALAVTGHGTGATVAWTESWYSGARYYSEVFWADLRASARVAELSAPSTAAVGLSMASSAHGREVLAWQACSVAAGTCTADAALRPHGGGWGPVRSLGAVDPTSFPVATQSRLGQSLVGWVSNGFVEACAARPGATGFYRADVLATDADDTNLALTFGAGAKAIAVWDQGTVDQKVVGARFTP